jgi:hypothetical protein
VPLVDQACVRLFSVRYFLTLFQVKIMLINSVVIALALSLRFADARPKCMYCIIIWGCLMLIEVGSSGYRRGHWYDRKYDTLDRRDPQLGRFGALLKGAASAGILGDVLDHWKGSDYRDHDSDDDEGGYYHSYSDKDWCSSYTPRPSPSKPSPAPAPYSWPKPASPVSAPPPAVAPAPVGQSPASSNEDPADIPYSNGAGWAPASNIGGWVPAAGGTRGGPSAPTNVPIPAPEEAQPQPQPEAPAPSPHDIAKPKGKSESREGGSHAKSLDVTTTAETVICRRFPDTLSAETVPLTVYPVQTQVNVNCWTTASMPGLAGKVQGDSIWLRTTGGCYINEQNVMDAVDFTVSLDYCVSPPHWVGTAAVHTTQQDCYQCPSLKCPSHSLGTGEYVDVQCVVDGEDARGNK